IVYGAASAALIDAAEYRKHMSPEERVNDIARMSGTAITSVAICCFTVLVAITYPPLLFFALAAFVPLAVIVWIFSARPQRPSRKEKDVGSRT
ncbi:MAG: hypothetical protein ACLQVD_14845, partial [Capsulimonadaceae bacterium]